MIVPQPVFRELYTNSDKFIFLITGGRGSGKSFNCGAFIERLTFEKTAGIPHNILYCRYTMTSASISVIPEMYEKIELDGTERYFRKVGSDVVNKATGGRIMFRGILASSGNQTAKLKSIQGLTTFVCDEAEEWTDEDSFEKLMFSIRQKGTRNRIIIIMNPTDVNHFIYRKYIKDTHRIEYYDGVPVQISTHPNVCHIHTSYFDNEGNLSEQFLKDAEAMKQNAPERYAHVFMGQWIDISAGVIFKKVGRFRDVPDSYELHGAGMDFGYTNDPTALIECWLSGNVLYMKERTYSPGLTTDDLRREVEAVEGLGIVCDSADPRLVDELCISGSCIYSVQKGGGSVLAGISKMQSLELRVHEDSHNLIEEFANYVWQKNRNGVYVNQPVDAYNHGIDAVRYFVLGLILGKATLKSGAADIDYGIY